MQSESEAPLPADGLIEVHDPAIDPSAIMATIRERIRARREAQGYDKAVFPTYGQVTYPHKPEDIPYDPNLYHHLHLANTLYTDVETESILAPSPATRLPVIGKLWATIREQAHSLVRFYVNRAVAHEVEVNRHLVNSLNLLTAENQRQQREIVRLQEQVAALRDQQS